MSRTSTFRPKLVVYSVLILIFAFPLLLIFVLPLLFFRYFILDLTLKKLFRPDLSELLSPTSSVFGSDDIYTNPKSVIVLTTYIQGRFPTEAFRKEFESKFKEKISCSFPHSNPPNDYIFPELKQYPSPWLGYIFWKNEDTFKIEDHIKELQLDDRLTNSKGVLRVVENLLSKPFEKRKSPWEFLICHDVDPTTHLNSAEKQSMNEEGVTNNSIVFFRMHHALGDGVSLHRIFSRVLSQESYNLEEILSKVKGGQPTTFQFIKQNPLKILYFPFKCVYETLESFANGADTNDWHDFENYKPSRLKWLPVNRISLKRLSSTRDKLNSTLAEKQNQIRLSTFSLILTGITMGIRDAMVANGYEIPQALHCACPLPLPGHPSKLSNHMTTCIVTLPPRLQDVKTIAEFIQIEISKIKASSIPWMGALPPNMLGILPRIIIKRFSRWNLTTGVVTNFPGPKDPMKILGQPILDLSGFVTFPGDTSFFAPCFGYNNKLAINIGFNEHLFPFKMTSSPEHFIDTAFQNILSGTNNTVTGKNY